MEELFRFKLHEWRAACTIPEDFTPPEDVDIHLVVDPSYTVNEGSDHTGIVVGYQCFGKEYNDLNLLHAASAKWKGLKLAEAVVDTIEVWKPHKITIERSSGQSCDMLVDAVHEKAQARGLSLCHIHTPHPNNTKQKRNRIHRLQDLFETNPPSIRMKYSAFAGRLCEEVEKFLYERRDNKGRPDDILDALAALAGF